MRKLKIPVERFWWKFGTKNCHNSINQLRRGLKLRFLLVKSWFMLIVHSFRMTLCQCSVKIFLKCQTIIFCLQTSPQVHCKPWIHFKGFKLSSILWTFKYVYFVCNQPHCPNQSSNSDRDSILYLDMWAINSCRT